MKGGAHWFLIGYIDIGSIHEGRAVQNLAMTTRMDILRLDLV